MKMIYTDLKRSNTIKDGVIANFEEFENIDEEIEKYERAIEEKKRGIAFQNSLIEQYKKTQRAQTGK